MKMLGNSNRDLNPLQKRWLYRCCTLSTALYGYHCGIITKCHSITPSKYSEKCNKELSYGYQMPFRHCLQEELRPSHASFLSTFILRNYITNFIQGVFFFLTTTSLDWFFPLTDPATIIPMICPSKLWLSSKDFIWIAFLLTWTIRRMNFSLLLILSIMNSSLDTVLLTCFPIDFLSIYGRKMSRIISKILMILL